MGLIDSRTLALKLVHGPLGPLIGPTAGNLPFEGGIIRALWDCIVTAMKMGR